MKKFADEYRKAYRSLKVKRALLRLAIANPEAVKGKDDAIIDVVRQIAQDTADAELNLRELNPYA